LLLEDSSEDESHRCVTAHMCTSAKRGQPCLVAATPGSKPTSITTSSTDTAHLAFARRRNRLVVQPHAHDESARGPSRRDWRMGTCRLSGQAVTLRTLRAGDAPPLLTALSRSEVLRYVAPAPPSIAGFRQFIRWAAAERRRGTHLCLGVIPSGHRLPVGVIQIWPIEADFSTAEWGIVVTESQWGTGVAAAAASLLFDFAFTILRVNRLEARVADANARANGLLRKLGARPEGTLRQGFWRDGAALDQVMWSTLAHEWPAIATRTRSVETKR
jgi:[ribosomal protein S5]-alanine N-acetyltransferase